MREPIAKLVAVAFWLPALLVIEGVGLLMHLCGKAVGRE